MCGKLIVIEGTDCSGKATQSKMLVERLNNEGIPTEYFDFPCYDTPTGKIVGGPYLGKNYICEGWFPETAPNVDAKVSSLYYAADRKYNIHKIIDQLEKGVNIVLDRYYFSNMGHQASKIKEKEKRYEMYKWIEKLEVELLELPKPDIKVFIHMPYEVSAVIRKIRKEAFDQNESNKEHLIHAEKAYLEIAELYDFKTIECIKENQILTVDEINDKLYEYVKEQL